MPLSRSLIVFAFVADSFAKTGDITLGLEPLFAPILQRRKGQTFNPEDFAQDVSNTYGIFMHPYVALDLAPRLAKGGLLHEVKKNNQVAGYTILDKGVNYPELKEEQISSLVEKFLSFSRARVVAHGLDFVDSQLEEALYARLITMEFLHIASRSQPSYLVDHTLRLRGRHEEPENGQLAREAQIDFLCADFIESLYRTDAKGFELLSDVSTGALLSEVVLGLRTPPASGQDGSRIEIYFDAPFIMTLLGLGSDEEKQYARLLYDAAKSTGAKMGCFDHNIEEIKANIDAPLGHLDQHLEVFGPTGRLLLRGSASRAFVLSIRRDVVRAVENLGISITETKTREFKELTKYFLYRDEEELANSLGTYQNVNAKLRDGASVANIIRLRAEKQQTATLFSCGAVFVTSNPRVATRANRHLQSISRRSGDSFPPVITDRYLAGALWIAQGGNGGEISRRKLLANCTTAMLPRRDVVTKMYNFLKQVDPEKAAHFDALITNDRCAYYLMEETIGDRDLLTLENCSDIYANIELATAERVISEKDTAIATLKEEHEKELTNVQERALDQEQDAATQIADLRAQLSAAEQAAGALRATIINSDAMIQRKYEESINRCVRAASNAGRLVIWVIAVSFALVSECAAVVFQRIEDGAHSAVMWIVPLISFLIIFCAFWEVPNFLFGRLVNGFRRRAFVAKARELGLDDNRDTLKIHWNAIRDRFGAKANSARQREQ